MRTMNETNSFAAAFSAELFRDVGYRIIGQLAEYLAGALEGDPGPVLPWVAPEDTAAAWPPDFTEEGGSDINELLGQVLAAANHLHYPGYMGHQVPGPLPVAALCDLLASFLNNSTTVYEMGMSGAGMERSVVRWMAQSLGFDAASDGMLTSGGSLGNLTGLLTARQIQAKPGDDRPIAVLVSSQAHYSVLRAVRIMGLDNAAIESVPVDAAYHMRPEELPEALRRAESRGRRVIAVTASACSTATGSYDPLESIAEFCAAHDLWLHVDAAHGGAACLSPRYRHYLKGIERADSVVWDAHKMLLMPSLITGVLFKDGRHASAAFEDQASYLYERDSDEEWYNFGHRTLECTKPLSCIKLYVALRAFGVRLFREYVTAAFDLARRFAAMLNEAQDFECAAEPESNIVCFRYIPAGAGELDVLQASIRRRLIADGRFYIVQTQLPGGLYLRTTLINPFTTESHLQQLLEAIRESAAKPSPA